MHEAISVEAILRLGYVYKKTNICILKENLARNARCESCG